MKHLDLFSGIGGFALASEMVWGKDVEHIFCDNEPFSQAILKKHWPNSPIYGDIRTLTADAERQRQLQPEGSKPKIGQRVSNSRVELLTGGFPCQPFSAAGRRRGTEDSRHLWPEMLRVIREFKPRWIIGENVGGLVTWSEGMVLEQIHLDLEAEGYEVQAFIIPAVAVNAPHRRDRVWIVACDPNSNGRTGGDEKVDAAEAGEQALSNTTGRYIPPQPNASNSSDTRLQGSGKKRQRQHGQPHRDGNNQRTSWNQNWIEVAAKLCLVDDGLPRGLARPRGWRNAALKGAGNAIVPQVAAEIMRGIFNLKQ